MMVDGINPATKKMAMLKMAIKRALAESVLLVTQVTM